MKTKSCECVEKRDCVLDCIFMYKKQIKPSKTSGSVIKLKKNTKERRKPKANSELISRVTLLLEYYF